MTLKKWIAGLLALTFLLTAGCALPGLGTSTRSGIVVASGSYAERQIMSCLLYTSPSPRD